MLNPEELAYIRDHAYLPEHVVPYVTSVSKSEPFLTHDFVCYLGKDALIFIGYPLQGVFREDVFARAVRDACGLWKPKRLSVIAPTTSTPLDGCSLVSSDHYYEVPIPTRHVPPKPTYMIRRASKDVTVRQDRRIEEPHLKLIRDFLLARQIDDATRSLYQRLPDYIASSETAVAFSAYRHDGALAAFSIGEYWGTRTAMYMFNFVSLQHRVPGASDLLLSALLREAEARGNTRVNLGLGINKGVTFFKKKWGGTKMWDYHHNLCVKKGTSTLTEKFRGFFSR